MSKFESYTTFFDRVKASRNKKVRKQTSKNENPPGFSQNTLSVTVQASGKRRLKKVKETECVLNEHQSKKSPGAPAI